MLTTCTKLVINKLRPAMDNLHNRLKVKLGKNKIFTTARKRILKLVELQSLVAKCFKIWNL